MNMEDNELFMYPKIDFVFKLIFGDERHKDILLHFLRCVISLKNDELESISLVGTELKKEYPDGKHGILDVAAKTKSGIQINIEIQLLYEKYMPKRTLYYWAKKYCEQLPAGKSYGELRPTIGINIINFNMFNTEKLHNIFYVSEYETHERLDESLEIHFLELPKLNNTFQRNELLDWLRFINAESKEEITLLAKQNEHIRDAKDILDVISKSEANRALYFSRQMAIHDAATREALAKEEGEAVGEARGEAIGEAKTIKAFLSAGLEREAIIKMLRISEERLKEILDK